MKKYKKIIIIRLQEYNLILLPVYLYSRDLFCGPGL